MRKIIFYFLILLLAVWFGVTMHHNPGYVLVSYRDLGIETSLWFAVVALIVLFILFHLFLRFTSGVRTLTSFIRQWISNRKKRRAHTQTMMGFYELIEGNWERSEKKLSRAAKYSGMVLVNYLAAALAAHHQREFKRRDGYLRLAQRGTKEYPVASGIAQVHLQMGNRQWEEASVTLRSLHRLQPKNIFILQLMHQVYLELKDWQSLEKLLPLFRKREVFAFDELSQLEQRVYQELFLIGAANHTIPTLWHNLPRYLRKNPALAAIYAKYLLTNNQPDEAEAILKLTIRKILDPRLLELYAELASAQPIKQLIRAEMWLKNDPENVDLLLCLGRLCRKQKLWGKARLYLGKSARLKPTLAVYAELAEITAEQHDLRGALDLYAKGCKLQDTAPGKIL